MKDVTRTMQSQLTGWQERNPSREEPTIAGRCPMCGYPNRPVSHDCMSMPLLTRLFQFAYVDGHWLYIVSRIDSSYILRADIGNKDDVASDDVLATLAGVRSPKDFFARDMGEGTKTHENQEQTWDMIRALRDSKDFDALRGITKVWRARWEVVGQVFTYERLLKPDELPPMWRRVALGDTTLTIPEPPKKFRGTDPFAPPTPDAPPVVSYTHTAAGNHAMEKRLQANAALKASLRGRSAKK